MIHYDSRSMNAFRRKEIRPKIPSAFHRRGQFYPEVGRAHVAGAQIIPKTCPKNPWVPQLCVLVYTHP
jgi:hypothetical protein